MNTNWGAAKKTGLLLILATAIVGVTLACDSFVYAVSIRNDTASTVVLRQCVPDLVDKTLLRRSECDVLDDPISLEPGASTRASASSSSHIASWYRVEDAAGNKTGCLRLQFEHVDRSIVRNVSQKEPCP